MTEQDLASDELYRIGTVAKLTGVSVERLRAWERRYGLAPSHRSGKIRFYSREQVERLQRIRELTDSGQAISTLIDLSDEQLADRLATTRKPAPTVTDRLLPTTKASVGLVGTNLLLLDHTGANQAFDVRGCWASADALHAEAFDPTALDALVIQAGSLNQRRLDALADAFPNTALAVLYQYSLPGFAAELPADRDEPIAVELWTGQWADVAAIVERLLRQRQQPSSGEPRHFSDAELIGIASSLDSDTGVPGHLVELITRLNALGEFADDCQRSADEEVTGDPVDALHDAATAASKARLLLELSLERWLERDQVG